MTFLIQKDLLSIRHESILVDALDRYSIPYIFVNIRPFTTEIFTYNENEELPE